MALIACPDCATNVSDAAPACPSCGRPIAGASMMRSGHLNPKATGTVQTTEQTGKGLKLQYALAVMALLVAVVGLIVHSQMRGASSDDKSVMIFGWMLGLAILWIIVVKIKMWWRHG